MSVMKDAEKVFTRARREVPIRFIDEDIEGTCDTDLKGFDDYKGGFLMGYKYGVDADKI